MAEALVPVDELDGRLDAVGHFPVRRRCVARMLACSTVQSTPSSTFITRWDRSRMNRPPGGGLPAHSAARPAPHALAIVAVLVAFVSAAVAAPVWTPSATAASGSPAATLIPSSGAVPVTIDTDIFSDVDDVGALATAFGLQLKGEARVVAIGVNSRTSRPAVATNSWKCAAALAQFYGFPATPIGTDTPNNGTEVNAPDFIGPCSTLASASTPVPGTAVAVYRQALSGQADGSVVMIGTGYFENLSTLLNSPGDAISPLSGRGFDRTEGEVVGRDGWWFPESSRRNQSQWQPWRRQTWPPIGRPSSCGPATRLVTPSIPGTRSPAASRELARSSVVRGVRGANNWVYSYDLTAVYHALRPTDPVLSEVGPGTNVVNADGSNVFTTGTGNQYYLRLADAGSLDVSIESLLDKLPPSGPDSTSPVITDVGTTGLPTGAVSISWTTDEPSNTQVEYGTTPVYDVTTPLAALPVIAHVQVVAGLVAGTTYHFRVKSVDPSSNSAASPDFTFVAPAAFSSDPADTFDSNAISPSKWTTQQVGSTVVAANQQLGYRASRRRLDAGHPRQRDAVRPDEQGSAGTSEAGSQRRPCGPDRVRRHVAIPEPGRKPLCNVPHRRRESYGMGERRQRRGEGFVGLAGVQADRHAMAPVPGTRWDASVGVRRRDDGARLLERPGVDGRPVLDDIGEAADHQWIERRRSRHRHLRQCRHRRLDQVTSWPLAAAPR